MEIFTGISSNICHSWIWLCQQDAFSRDRRHILMPHIPMATFTHGRHLPIAFIRYDSWFIRYLINVAYGYLSRENWGQIEAMGKCRLWVNVSWVNVVMGRCLMGRCRLTLKTAFLSGQKSTSPFFGRTPRPNFWHQINFWGTPESCGKSREMIRQGHDKIGNDSRRSASFGSEEDYYQGRWSIFLLSVY